MCAPCASAQTVMKTNSIEIKNMAPPPMIDKISNEFLTLFSKMMNNRIIMNVINPKVVVDMCWFKVAFPKMIQLIETTTEFETSTRYGIVWVQYIHDVTYPNRSL